ncbi:helix-turn-helix domain-containing protein [Paenibacillus filicis]|uniref:Helix-turn-helix domain-containing protein n=1 Tax=Paenibacillus gyeongsangnamensis TaxID=3388067 RepID=A0ABT4Q298_9BACL|nr:helix-turn-helix domain-containing protein [Paenibacillus filicis]MCZ8510959.1 helix-turn-helix domain-containing protein [Paenibacillus filicis]
MGAEVMKSFIQEKALFFKYLMSYVIILFLCILIMVFFVNNRFIGVLKDELIANNANTLNRVMYIVDANIKQFGSIQTHIQMNRNLNPYYALNDPNLAIDAQRELGKYLASNSLIKDIIVYFRGDSYIYSSTSSYSIPLFINHAFRYSHWTEEDFKKDINSLKVPKVRPAEDVIKYDREPERMVTFLYPISSFGTDAKTTVLFLVNEQSFTKMIEDNFGGYRSSILILDQTNQVITSSSNSINLTSDNLKEYLGDNGNHFTKMVEVDNKKMLMSVLKSDETGWKYIAFTPMQDVLKKTNGIQAQFILVVLLLLVIGSIIIYFNMQTNYKPIYNLKNYATRILQHTNQSENEIDVVKNTIDFLSNQNKSLISSTRIASKDFILDNLLKGRIHTLEDLKQQGEPFAISFRNPLYLVVIVLLHTHHARKSQTVQELLDQFERISNLFFNGYVREHLDQKKMVCILSLDEVQSESLLAELEAFQICLREEIEFQTTFGVGNVYHDIKDIPLSYVEASAALDYRLVKGNGSIILNKELSYQDDSLDSYPHKELDILKSLIKQGNDLEIKNALNNIINYIKTCNSPLFVARGLCFDILNVIWRTFTEINKELLLPKDEYPNASMLAEFETVEELTDLVKNICSNLCSFIRENKTAKDQSLIADAVSYIQSHYANCDFSIQNMADHFGMTLTNLSQYFKNQTGQTIIDYTTNLRMNKAKELLMSSDLTLNELSVQVGYLNSSSFIRRFKQITGLTPGQYMKEKRKC